MSRLGGHYDGCVHTEALGPHGKVADLFALVFSMTASADGPPPPPN